MNPFESGLKTAEVPAMTLDEYCRTAEFGASGKVDFIKIDVQGAEELALRGAEEVLRQHKPEIICEFEEGCLQGMGTSTPKLKAYLHELGYLPYRIAEEGLLPISPDMVHGYENLVMLNKENPQSREIMGL